MTRVDETVYRPSDREAAHLLSLSGYYEDHETVPADTVVWTITNLPILRDPQQIPKWSLSKLQRNSDRKLDRCWLFDPALLRDNRFTYYRPPRECIRPGSEADRYAESLLTVLRLLESP